MNKYLVEVQGAAALKINSFDMYTRTPTVPEGTVPQ